MQALWFVCILALFALYIAGLTELCLVHLNIPTPRFILYQEATPLVTQEIAIISAVTGKTDQSHTQQQDSSTFFYNETIEQLPFPRHGIDQRLRAKYFKMSSHWLHPEYAAYIWVDGSFDIDPVGLRSFMLNELASADCAFFAHPKRHTIVEEYKYIDNAIAPRSKSKYSEYLRARYADEPMKSQVDAYIADGFPEDRYPLLAGGLFIRRNVPHVNAAFDHWLIENFKWTIQDQLSLPFILWKHNVRFNVINGNINSGPYHKFIGHANPVT